MIVLSAFQGALGVGAPVVADQSAVALTTVLTGATYLAPANSLKAGQVFYLRNEVSFVHTAASTPAIACNLIVGASLLSFSIPPIAAAATFRGYAEAYLTVRSIGATASIRASLRLKMLGAFVANAYGGNENDGTGVRDTTAVAGLQIALQMNMTSAVAGNTLTVGQGFVARVFG